MQSQLIHSYFTYVVLQRQLLTSYIFTCFSCYLVYQELEESRIRTTTQMEEVDGRIEQEYEARLQDALREIRAQHDYDLQSVKVELESMYEGKVQWQIQGPHQVGKSGKSREFCDRSGSLENVGKNKTP